MGNKNSNQKQVQKYHWTQCGNQNGIDLFQSRNNIVAQRRRITLQNHFNLDHQKRIYSMREHNQRGYVQVYEVIGVEQPNKKTSFCQCTSSQSFYVYSQRIQHRLSDIPQLSFRQSLNILEQCCTSFQKLYQDMGPFHINGELIGFNIEGNIKVWLNQNWALNNASHEISPFRTMSNTEVPSHLKNESQMVNNLLQVIEQKSEGGRFPQPFGQNVYNNSDSFKRLKKYLESFMQNQYPVSQTPNFKFQNHHPHPHVSQQPIELVQSTHPVQNNNKPVFGQKVNSSVIMPPSYRPPQNKPHVVRSNFTFNQQIKPVEQSRPEPSKVTDSNLKIYDYERPPPGSETKPIQYIKHSEHYHQPYQSSFQQVHHQNNAPQVHFKSSIGSRPPLPESQRPVEMPQSYHSIPNAEGSSSQYPKFKLMNDGNSYPQNSAISIQGTEVRSPSTIPSGHNAVVSSQPNIMTNPVGQPDPQITQLRSQLKHDMDNHRTQYRIVENGAPSNSPSQS